MTSGIVLWIPQRLGQNKKDFQKYDKQTRLMRDFVLTSIWTRLDRIRTNKAECVVSKWAYRVPKEDKIG